ncbi:glutamate-5-semialdehyde dehydrogenase [Loktanella fryxellensis]|uniref:Gamma-glutamyl phosphate reductase n=1 Tax=Loktanella fryxellensis TaxID=245187 RepID=A0A1H8ED77_9RHOB|nr:glutamate-5-semialdehyde dehydrogenase [Loktanella fryxellensis]SEN17455.1 glutamate-5-semialdehyde dehydrogenase [Loktanella fryxellensis]
MNHMTPKTDGETDVTRLIADQTRRARVAATALALATPDQRSAALTHAAQALRDRSEAIVAANAADVASLVGSDKDAAFIDRLTLTPARVAAMADALIEIAAQPDPLGQILETTHRPNGLRIERVSVPIGVIAMIYESRPNVGADAGALCIKSGNAVILRGGSESLRSSRDIVACLTHGLTAAGLPADAVQLVDTTDRAAVRALLHATGAVDLVIPRGGRGLVSLVQAEARVPTLLHLDGNNHTYVHASADVDQAVRLVRNAKMRRTGVCGSTECAVVDRAIAPMFLPALAAAMTDCELRGDDAACAIVPAMTPATDADWDTEYLSNILSVRVVDDLAEAIAFIQAHSSAHTEAIVATDTAAARTFMAAIDAAIVMHNASTQFADGGEFGMGAEIGIATGRMHARGPVGAAQLTSYKYLVFGDGQERP